MQKICSIDPFTINAVHPFAGQIDIYFDEVLVRT